MKSASTPLDAEGNENYDIPNLTEHAVNVCLRLGGSEADVFAEASQLTEIYIERNEILSERRKVNRGLGVRCLLGKRLGFAYTTLLNKQEIAATANLAYKIAKTATPNPDWVKLPQAGRYPSVEGIYDEHVNSLSVEDAVRMAREGLEAARSYDTRVNVDSGKLGAASSQVFLLNSNGIKGTEKSTELYLYLVTLAADAEPGSFAIEYDLSTKLQIDPPKVGIKAAEKAIKSLGGKTPENFKGSAIFSPDSAAEVVASVIDSGINGEEVYRKRSPLAGRIGEAVSNDMLTVIDDGTMPEGIATSTFDDEGTPRRRTPLIEKGVLKNYLYDSFAAHREGKESTGNGARGGGGARYASLPRTTHSNLLIQEGNETLDDMIRQVEKGILVGRFSGNITELSGDFSGTVKQGFYIKEGEIQYPLARTMIAGNVYQLLSNIHSIGKPAQPTFDGTYIPPIRIDGVAISTES